MIKAEAKQLKNKILKQIDSLGLKLNPKQRLKIAKSYVGEIEKLQIDVLYTYVMNDLREDLERICETGKY